MPAITNKSVIFAQEPHGLPVDGQDMKVSSSEIDLDSTSLSGGILVKTIVISLDPTLRNSMRYQEKPYSKLYIKGKAMWGFGIAEVVRSESSNWKEGELVWSYYSEMSDYAVIPKEQLGDYRKITRLPELNITQYVGAAGMPGMTAYMSLKEIIGDYKPNSKMFVSSAAGAVGQLVVQLAKQGGVKVIASAGGEEKVKFLKEKCGADVAFDYKTADINQELRDFGGKEGIDYYFDNVGGEQLNAYLANSAVYGTVVVCGAITAYNATADNPGPTISNFPLAVLTRQLTVRGFLVTTFMPKWLNTFMEEMPRLLVEKKIKAKEDVRYGLETIGQSMVDMLTGKSDGKVVVLVDTERKDKWMTRTTNTFDE